MKKNKDHLIWNFETGDLECRHCGTKQSVAMPVYLTIFLAMMKAFEKMHMDCQKPIEENKPNEVN